MSNNTNQKFKDFNFKNNTEWQEYKRNITLVNNNNAKHQYKKLKIKWYKRYIDTSFNPEQYKEWEASQTAKQTSPQPPKTTPPPPNTTPQPAEATYAPYTRANLTLTENILRGAHFWTVLLYVSFFITFFLRIPFGVYFWQYSLVSSLIAYAISLSAYVRAHWPQTLSLKGVFLAFATISQQTDFQYCFYCITLLYSQHISLIAITPLAIFAFYHSLSFLGPLLSMFKNYSLLGQMSEIIQMSTRHQSTLVYWAAACEILTFTIFLWRYTMGYNRDIFLIHVFLMFQFISQRFNSSPVTKEIITTFYNKIKSFLPMLPNLPNTMTQ